MAVVSEVCGTGISSRKLCNISDLIPVWIWPFCVSTSRWGDNLTQSSWQRAAWIFRPELAARSNCISFICHQVLSTSYSRLWLSSSKHWVVLYWSVWWCQRWSTLLSLSCLVHILLVYRTPAKLMPRHSFIQHELNITVHITISQVELPPVV